MVGLTGHRGISVYLWFLVIVGFTQNSSCMEKTSMACYSSPSSCNLLTMTCSANQRIRLLDQMYNHSNNSGQCSAETDSGQCYPASTGSCCVIENKNCQASFTKEQAYNLYRDCSGLKSNCQSRAPQGKLIHCTRETKAIYPESNFVMYDCVDDEDIVHFCDEVSVRGTSVHVIFNGTETNEAYTNHTCSCTITGDTNVPWTIHSEDIRYYRVGDPKQCASVNVSGVEQQCNISEENSFIYQTQWDNTQNVITLDNLFKLGKDDKPTMVWIRVDGQGNPVTVQCNGAAAPPPVGGLGSGSSVGDKGGMVAAVVVPILLIVIGIAIALGILYWRKRRQQNAKQTTGNVNGVHRAHNNAYTKGDNHTRITTNMSKETDNYIDFSADQNGDDYATIESTAISPYSLARDVADIDTCYATPVDAVDTDYNKLNLVTKVVVRDPNYSRLPGSLNDDYSHVTGVQGSTQNATGGNATGNEYAHVNVQGDSQSYSELEKNPPITKMEDNPYDHVRRAISANENAQSQNVNDNAVTSPNNPPYPSSEEQDVHNSEATLEDTNATHDYYILSKVADI